VNIFPRGSETQFDEFLTNIGISGT